MARVLALAALGQAAATTITATPTFESFVKEFGKTYTSEAEAAQRQAIFEQNVEKINKHNAEGHSWAMKINQFADLTQEEFSKQLGYHKPMARAQKLARERSGLKYPEFHGSFPDSVDWRTKGVVTPVKNQGFCGSCWTFGATETLESHLAIATGKLEVLSEQEIVSCLTDSYNPKHCGGTGGCKGGTAEVAFDYIQQNGLPSEEDYPYTSGDSGNNGVCHASGAARAVKITGYQVLAPNNYTAVLGAIATVGPMAITVDAAPWQFYDKGIYTPRSYATLDLDHAVQLVGYGSEDGTDYWLVRNSWDTVWGEDGYIRLKKNDGSEKYCGVDNKPADGTGCDDGPAKVTACGTSGILYDVTYPTGAAPWK